ncbi:MAG: hypothetical protein JSS86_12410 [Cyanobacteria bacterium SZAS LIN-2]|nr:hypothetical protein [Cyanobacteria bacterium SZAS LIN-3]MBS1997113.1 hypothetical protein [Cyanobacteria bacterium SZAS LIN-2]MBS2006374.1 hypothetical protein [Cyanobacteria bacterium SZAS TMP-1]
MTSLPSKTIKLSTVIALMTFEFLLVACLSSMALSQSQIIYNNLLKSRDALMDQRRYLISEADRLNQQMIALKKNIELVNGYLRDNDKAVADVDNALRRAQ